MNKDLYTTLNYLSVAFALFWTATLGGLLYWAEYKESTHVVEYARKEARANFNKDIAFRNWMARRGGIYVQVSDLTQPNPYLSHIPDRDIEKPSGEKLTLMNPAYVLRQTMQEFSKLYGVRGRITSLKPLNPDNAPDEWEAKVLKSFELGSVDEVYEVNNINNNPYLRYMQAFITKKGCIKCHEHQGYKVGDIRGGIGVNIPLEPYIKIKKETIKLLRISYASLFLLGMIIIGFIYRIIKIKIKCQHEIESKLEAAKKNAELLSMHDPLTNLPNRRYFREYFENKLAQANRNEKEIALLYIDLDGFKAINDDISHQAGDEVLTALVVNGYQNPPIFGESRIS